MTLTEPKKHLDKAGVPWYWRDQAREFLVIHQQEGAEAALKYILSYRRIDKLKKAIKKEIDEATTRSMARSGSPDGTAVPSGGAESPLADDRHDR